MRILTIFEDTMIDAKLSSPNAAVATGFESGEMRWLGECVDLMTGKEMAFSWTNDQMSAVIALAMGVGEEDTPGFNAKNLYAIAEPLFKDWPKECRPIP